MAGRMSTKSAHQVAVWPKVILFGDSLTQFSFSSEGCWGALLADKLQRKCDVINRGFAGYNSRWCKVALRQVVDAEMAPEVAVVTILLGSNDSDDDPDSAQRVPLAEYEQNLADMAEYLMSVGVSRDKIILICPPPCEGDTCRLEAETKGQSPGGLEGQTTRYAEACRRAAVLTGTHCVDLHTLILQQPRWESECLEDGLHLSTQGSTLLHTALWPLVDGLTRTLPVMFPPWDE